MSSNSFGVDLVVLAMRACKADIRDLALVVHGDYQPVIVALDVKNDTVPSDKTGVSICCFNG